MRCIRTRYPSTTPDTSAATSHHSNDLPIAKASWRNSMPVPSAKPVSRTISAVLRVYPASKKDQIANSTIWTILSSPGIKGVFGMPEGGIRQAVRISNVQSRHGQMCTDKYLTIRVV